MSKTILITGAGSGFGLGAGVSLRVEKLDVTDSADRRRAEDWDVDVLVKTTGIGESGPLAEIPVDLVLAKNADREREQQRGQVLITTPQAHGRSGLAHAIRMVGSS